MELKSIIKSDKDRLFILDYECFIIFTADDLIDEKPFIRIGNWINLPPESIPLIENIIVTDTITGDPGLEQFNIDPRFLSTNRYIGSRQVVKNYLDFQKNFGLDLNNVSIVDVEKDLPYLSKEKSISSKDSFLGIFYRDGNFRVVYKNDTLFDLKEYEEKSPTLKNRHERICSNNKDSLRYAGSGIVLLENSALFYKNRYFTGYQFRKDYLSDFDNLEINPAKIREILYPASLLTNITEFIKWSNSKKNLIKIYSYAEDMAASLQKLFPDVLIKNDNFHGHSFDTGDGLSVQNYPGSINVKLTYKNTAPSSKKLELAFIKEYTGIKEIIKEKIDGIIVPYSIYENAALFFKSTASPVLCINDGNRNINKLKGNSITILSRKIQYEFNKFDDEKIIQSVVKMLSDSEILESINAKDAEGINEIIFKDIRLNENLAFSDIKELLNIKSLLKIILNTTTDRKFSSEIQKILQKTDSLFNKNKIIEQEANDIKISLYFYKNSVFEFFEKIIHNTYNPGISDVFSERIQQDRIRFLDLLALYRQSPNKSRKDFALLNDEINKRKELYNREQVSIDKREIKRNILTIKLKKILKAASIIFIVFLLSILSITGINYYNKYREARRIEEKTIKQIEAEKERIAKEKQDREALIEKYQIHVSDYDIYIYANKVARKNGYKEIDYKLLKEKNPNWIFPGNIFYLIDEEKIIVKSGDTLWDISDKKLMIIHMEFYKLIDKIAAAESVSEKNELLGKANALAFSKKHFNKLNEIKGLLKK